MFAVTTFAVFWNIMMNKIKFEKQRLFVVEKMYMNLFDNAVKSDVLTLSVTYENYKKKSYTALEY